MLCKELQDTQIGKTMQQNAALTLLNGAPATMAKHGRPLNAAIMCLTQQADASSHAAFASLPDCIASKLEADVHCFQQGGVPGCQVPACFC
jgi:hypothetical protein